MDELPRHNPVNIQNIRDAIRNGRYRTSDHAKEETEEDEITEEELKASVLDGEVIEEYPDDKPFPSCLIYGRTTSTYPLHSVWGYNADERSAVLITAYRPDPGRWVEWRIRR